MNKQTISIAVVALIVGAGLGYVAHPSSGPGLQGIQGGPMMQGNGSFSMGTGGGRGMMGGGFLTGTVASQTSTSLTLNTRDGSSKVVLLTNSTSVSKTVAGSLSDVAVGSNVMVIGTTNSDGSISASTIELRPASSTQPR